jgi:glycosyltransferase involved in cell wall biosynthesis
MSSGLPLVVSDLPVHREICGDAGIYFPRFSPEVLAERVLQIHESPALAQTLSRNALRRARDFSWSEHVDRLLVLAQQLAPSVNERN